MLLPMIWPGGGDPNTTLQGYLMECIFKTPPLSMMNGWRKSGIINQPIRNEIIVAPKKTGDPIQIQDPKKS